MNETYGQLEMISNQIVSRIFMRFPTMVSEVMDIIVKALSKERDYTLEIVESIIDSEQYYHFTNDDDYNANRSGIVAGEQSRPGPGGPNG